MKRSMRPVKFAFYLGLCLLLSGWLLSNLSDFNRSKPVRTAPNQRQEAIGQKEDVVTSGIDETEPGEPPMAETGKLGREPRALESDRAGGHARYDKPREAVEFFRRKRLPEGETELPIERYFAALDAMRGMPQYSSADGLELPSRARMANVAAQQQLGAWTPLGPGNIGGRTRALLIHPTNPGTMYAAGVAGGVWRTTDGGANWAPAADLIANLAVSSLAMEPGNPSVIYAGTGEGFFNIDSVRGAGIFKTMDGGTSWMRLAGTNTSDFHFVNDIVVSTVNSQRLYAATRTGVWRSIDGGATWTRVLAVGVQSGCTDLAARTDRPTDFLFAACGNFQQATLYRNTDAAAGSPWTAVLADPGMGRTSLAIAPSDQNVVYALSASIAQGPFLDGLHAVFRSTSSGDPNSWTAQARNTSATKLNTTLLSNPYVAFYGDCGFTPFGPNFIFSQGWYDNVIAVDPTNPNRVWAGGIDLFRSDDGGANWGLASYWWANGGIAPLAPQYAHADQHVIVFHPQYNGTTNRTLFVGNDGGIFRTTDASAPVAAGGVAACNPSAAGVMWTPLNNNYGVTQFYHGVSYPNGASYFGGTQDNGTLRGSDAGGPNSWREILGGDGGYVAVDPTNTNILYAENTGISIQKSTDGGASFVSATDGISDGGQFITPFVMDPSDPRRLWTGGAYLWRTTNGAASWTRASAITAGRSLVSAIAVAPTNANSLLAGMGDGFILRTDIGLTSISTTVWPSVQPRTGYVSWVAFDPANKDIAYATYSTFGGTHVWRSTTGGASWTGIDGSGAGALPDVPVHCIVVDPLNTARLYAGTDLGVFVSTNGGASWAVENTGFANVIVESLNLNVVNGVTTLFAFTHGRGAWRVTANQTGCLFALSPAGQFFTGAGGTGTINVAAAPAGCSWTATSGAPWITINTGGSGSGNGAVGFTVAANTTVSARTGTITAAGRTFTVTQQGCAAIAPTFQHFEAAGGPGNITVTAATGCSWTVANSNSWITINTGAGSGTGAGTVGFTVAANTSSVSRASTLTVGGQAFTVIQAGAGGTCAGAPITAGQSVNGALAASDCRSLGRGGAYYADRYTFNGQAGQQIAIGLSAPRFDTYLYLLDAAGNIVAQGDSGGGGANQTDSRIPETGSFFTLPATGAYTIEATSFGANRTGNYTLSLSVGAANCSYAIATASSQSFGIGGGAGSVSVTAGAGCAWQAVAQAPWITITSGASASGNGTVNFTVAPNNTIGPRTGTIIIAGQVFSVTQGGLPALYRGEWIGTTSAGLPIRFQVDANDMLIYLEVDVRVSFSFGTCIYTLVSTDVAPIENGQFAVPLVSTGFLLFSNTPFARGTLTTSTASGRTDNLSVSIAICGNTLTFTSITVTGPTWNVQRQVACPTVSNIVPASGSAGASVTINGTNFTDVAGVKFGNLAASFTVNGDTRITVVVPAGATTGPITISKAGCSDVQTPSFTVIPCPTVSGFNPVRGLAGSTVTITGAGLDTVTAVKFAGGATAQFTANNATSLTATVPAGAMTGPITLSKSGCPDAQTASFTVCSPISVSPASLPDGPGGVAYAQTLTASGGAAPYNFAVTTGALPGGLTLSSGGALSGTPNVAGTFNFTVTATDANGCTGTRSYTVNITVPPLGAQTRALYVLNDSTGGNKIFGYAVNEATGALTLFAGFPISTGGNGVGGSASELLTIDRANQRLYGVNRLSNTVSAYAINPTTGALSPLPFSPISLGSGDWLTIAVHPSGSPLVVGDGSNSNRLASYQISATTATPAVGSPFNTGSAQPISTAFSQDGNYVYTGGRSNTTIAGFSINAANGVLTALTGSPFNSGGALPMAYATDTVGRLLVANYTAGQVRALITTSGIPTAASGNPFASGLTGVAHGILHPNGFYMVADQGVPGMTQNRVGIYRINGSGSATTLTAVPGSPFSSGGSTTIGLALNQAGTFLFAASSGSLNLTTFSVNPTTGALTALSTQPSTTLGNPDGSGLGRLAGMAYLPSPCPTIALSPATLPNDTVGTAYNQTVAASPAGSYNFSATAGALPAGLSLNAATGAITGTPTTAGTFNFTITALSFGPCSGSHAYTLTVNNPVPALAGLNPNAATAGGGALTLSIAGTDFVNGARVRWNGNERTTTFVSSTQLTASIPASDIATAGTVNVTVFNPAPGGGASAARTFTINNLEPALTGLNPAAATAGGAGFTLTAAGTNFVNGSVVRWNGADRVTTFVSGTQLTAAITAADIAAAGAANVTVFNPAPGGGVSSGLSFAIRPPAMLSSLNPNVVVAGGAAFTLTANGRDFASGATVRWNGANRVTTFVNSTQLTAAIPATDIAMPGVARITVFNPEPGGGSSNELMLIVAQPVANVSAASFLGAALAPDSIVAAFGTKLATAVKVADTIPLPTELEGTTVKITDSLGAERLARLFFVAPSQINYLMPAETAAGAATVTVKSGDGSLSIGAVQIALAVPSLFTANASGQGVAAGVALRVKADGAQVFEPIARFDAGQNRFVAVPIDLDNANELVFPILYGSGIRYRSSLSAVTITIGGLSQPVLFAGAVDGFFGLDQLNIGPLSRTLIGRGEVDVVLTVDGKQANTVKISIK